MFEYFNDAKNELAKVSWPSTQETMRLTIMVVVVGVITGLLVGGVDFGLTKLIGALLPQV